MAVDVILGLQWGDEGKGKIVDVLTKEYDIIARFQGGPNAGHTLEFNNQKYVLKSIPSGIFQKNKINIIGNGVVLDPDLFKQEVDNLESLGHDISKIVYISKKAHLILPTHRMIDIALEKSKGNSQIGTTGKGIGPTYADKIARQGLRVGDLLNNFNDKYQKLVEIHKKILDQYNFEYDLSDIEYKWFQGVEKLKTFKFIDAEHFINNNIESKKILAEGAQGSMLDIDFGSYPFVTSSNTICAGACTGLGVSPHKIGEVYGIFKAYCTRVGSGPFPTELFGEEGEKLRNLGNEYGSVTGRPRRCGWIDLVALKYTIMINGVTKLVMMKSDILDSLEKIKVCIAYRINGKETVDFPYDISDSIEPVYKELDGWKTDLSKINNSNNFPPEFEKYLLFLEQQLGVPIAIVSFGPDRNQTIFI